jgi:hypothetical protein
VSRCNVNRPVQQSRNGDQEDDGYQDESYDPFSLVIHLSAQGFTVQAYWLIVF